MLIYKSLVSNRQQLALLTNSIVMINLDLNFRIPAIHFGTGIFSY